MRRYWTNSISLAGVTLLCITSGALAQDGCQPMTFEGAFDGEVTLCQNWNAKQQQEFWFTPQGSRIIPYNWFLALRKPGSDEKFASAANMNRLRYLPQKATDLNRDALPIGFTRDEIGEDDSYYKYASTWLGMTCAACHTNQIEHNGKKILIDGAPSMADFEEFMKELTDTLAATNDGGQKFDAFAREVLGDSNVTTENNKQLKTNLETIIQIRTRWNERNKGDHRYGFGRLDAIGAIFNAVGASAQGEEDPSAGHRANAPVSYPFIWDTPQHDRVQWNGSVANENAGALGRNIGEVLGVFGDLKLNPINFDPEDCVSSEGEGLFSRGGNKIKSLFVTLTDENICVGHQTSVKIENLGNMEDMLRSLWSPKWPNELLGSIDDSVIDVESGKTRLQLGRELYEKRCLGCHDGRSVENKNAQPFERDYENRFIDAELVPVSKVKTDELMAKNFAEQSYPISTDLRRQLKSFLPLRTPEISDYFGDNGKGHELLKYSVFGTIVNKLLNEPSMTVGALAVGQEPKVQAFLETLQQDLITANKSGSQVEGLRVLLKAAVEIKRRKIASLAETSDNDPMFEQNTQLDDIIKKLLANILAGRSGGDADAAATDGLMVYKARPLNGIWATGPYLHNGSVRTIRQLLLPAECTSGEGGNCRDVTFKVGSREFDPEGIGFKNEGDFELDTSLPGNRNTGHEYGLEIGRDGDKLRALLEYIKTL